MVNAELNRCTTVNCIPLSDITILNVPSRNDPADVVNLSSNRFVENNFTPASDIVELKHNHVLNSGLLSDFSRDIVHHIAGFVARKLGMKLKCPECIKVLYADDVPFKLSFLRYKMFGKLVYPANDLFRLCLQCESAFCRNIKCKKLPDKDKKFIILHIEQEILARVSSNNYFIQLMPHQMDNDPLDNHYLHNPGNYPNIYQCEIYILLQKSSRRGWQDLLRRV